MMIRSRVIELFCDRHEGLEPSLFLAIPRRPYTRKNCHSEPPHEPSRRLKPLFVMILDAEIQRHRWQGPRTVTPALRFNPERIPHIQSSLPTRAIAAYTRFH